MDDFAQLVGKVRDGVIARTHAPEVVAARELEAREREARLSRWTIDRELQAIPARFSWARLLDGALAPAPDGRRVGDPKACEQSRKAAQCPRVVWRGQSGKGKTTLACATLRLWIESGGQGAVFVGARRLATARSRHPLGEGEPPIVERAIAARLLLIDDLGEGEPAHASAVADVICDRYDRDLPTWYTLWTSADEVKRIYGEGIARRVFERAAIVECG